VFQSNSHTDCQTDVKKVNRSPSLFSLYNNNTKSTVSTEIFVVSVTSFEIHQLADYEDPHNLTAEYMTKVHTLRSQECLSPVQTDVSSSSNITADVHVS
jgi:hypothetical protein